MREPSRTRVAAAAASWPRLSAGRRQRTPEAGGLQRERHVSSEGEPVYTQGEGKCEESVTRGPVWGASMGGEYGGQVWGASVGGKYGASMGGKYGASMRQSMRRVYIPVIPWGYLSCTRGAFSSSENSILYPGGCGGRGGLGVRRRFIGCVDGVEGEGGVGGKKAIHRVR